MHCSHPHFGVILDDVLSEIVGNVMKEAVLGEVLLTTRPRIVALPPSSKPNLHIRLVFILQIYFWLPLSSKRLEMK